jgi:hypothetical protein
MGIAAARTARKSIRRNRRAMGATAGRIHLAGTSRNAGHRRRPQTMSRSSSQLSIAAPGPLGITRRYALASSSAKHANPRPCHAHLATCSQPAPPGCRRLLHARESSSALAHPTSWARPRRRRADARSLQAMRKRATSESEARSSSRAGVSGVRQATPASVQSSRQQARAPRLGRCSDSSDAGGARGREADGARSAERDLLAASNTYAVSRYTAAAAVAGVVARRPAGRSRSTANQ